MTISELHAKLQATKAFLHKEIVRNRIAPELEQTLSYREIDTRLDMIHEAERVGVRNLGERANRKLKRMIRDLESDRNVSLN